MGILRLIATCPHQHDAMGVKMQSCRHHDCGYVYYQKPWQCVSVMYGSSAGAAAMFSSYKCLDCYSLLQDPLPGVEVHVVRAANSDRWSKRELQQLHEMEEPSEQPKVIFLQTIRAAGAWRRSN